MNHDKELFDISKSYYEKIDVSLNDTDEIELLEKELLLIILNDKGKTYNGILKTKFRSSYWNNGNSDLGYKQIKKLIKLNRFDFFASKYCLYLGTNKENDNSYFEIIWDYKTYYESLSSIEELGLKQNKLTFKKN